MNDEPTTIRQKIDQLLDEIWHRYIARAETFLSWAEGIELGEAPPIVNCRCTMIPVVEGKRADYVIHDEPMRLRQEDLIDGVDLLELDRRIMEAAMKSWADQLLDELEAWADSIGDDEDEEED